MEQSASLDAGRRAAATIRMHDVSTRPITKKTGRSKGQGQEAELDRRMGWEASCQAENERTGSVQRRPNGKSGLLPVQAR